MAVLLHPSGEDNRRLLVGNAGDSRCIIVQKGYTSNIFFYKVFFLLIFLKKKKKKKKKMDQKEEKFTKQRTINQLTTMKKKGFIA